jgi:DNA repair protein RecO (recombination protein O)
LVYERMSSFSTPAIMLRRIDFGDYDLIISFLTLAKGKISAIAKSAKKSTKRFSGSLELFSVIELVCRTTRGKGLPILEEATLKGSFPGIRGNITKTAYASYWAELINAWMEENEKNEDLYYLFAYVLEQLDLGQTSEAALSIFFQMRFLRLSGLSPNLNTCGTCRTDVENINKDTVAVDLLKGGVECGQCAPGYTKQLCLSKGTIKQLRWIEGGDIAKASRIRLSPLAVKEGLAFLEAFVPYHLGKKTRSLAFLQQIRS